MTMMTTLDAVVTKLRRGKSKTVVYMRVRRAAYEGEVGLFAADESQKSILRDMMLKFGQVIGITISFIRNAGFHRKLHALCAAVAANSDELEMYQRHPHRLLKRFQMELRLHCEELMMEGGNLCFLPLSFSFDKIDEHDFVQVYRRIMQHVRERYMPGMTDEAIELLAAFEADQG